MLPAQIANVAEAALGPLPTTSAFLHALTRARETPGTPGQALFGQTFAENQKQPPGSEKNQGIALKCAKEFQKVCEMRQTPMENLDEWMCSWAMFTLDVDFLLEDDTARTAAITQRKELCQAAEVDMRSWTPQTLKTMVNALALLYKMTPPTHGIVPSCFASCVACAFCILCPPVVRTKGALGTQASRPQGRSYTRVVK